MVNIIHYKIFFQRFIFFILLFFVQIKNAYSTINLSNLKIHDLNEKFEGDIQFNYIPSLKKLDFSKLFISGNINRSLKNNFFETYFEFFKDFSKKRVDLNTLLVEVKTYKEFRNGKFFFTQCYYNSEFYKNYFSKNRMILGLGYKKEIKPNTYLKIEFGPGMCIKKFKDKKIKIKKTTYISGICNYPISKNMDINQKIYLYTENKLINSETTLKIKINEKIFIKSTCKINWIIQNFNVYRNLIKIDLIKLVYKI